MPLLKILLLTSYASACLLLGSEPWILLWRCILWALQRSYIFAKNKLSCSFISGDLSVHGIWFLLFFAVTLFYLCISLPLIYNLTDIFNLYFFYVAVAASIMLLFCSCYSSCWPLHFLIFEHGLYNIIIIILSYTICFNVSLS